MSVSTTTKKAKTSSTESGFSQFLDKIVNDHVFPALKDNAKNIGNKPISWEIAVTKKDQFVLRLYPHFQTLTNSIEYTKSILKYMEIEQVPKEYTSNGIEDKEYYKYHFENFQVRCVTLMDLTAHYINQSLNLGYPDRNCKLEFIAENENIKGTPLGVAIKKLTNDYSELKHERNVIVHKVSKASKDFLIIGTVDYIINWNSFLTEPRTSTLKSKKELAISKIIAEMNDVIDKLEGDISNVILHTIPGTLQVIRFFESLK
ncbi:MAG: hypothetical protein HYZ14_11935 [Bacteroidetes bacterium]|nr:hypothetical protein [Bacteroidota bacterium]